MTLGTNWKFYTSVVKGLKLKVRKFWEIILTSAEVTRKKLIGRPFCPPHPILNRVKVSAEKTNIKSLLDFLGSERAKFLLKPHCLTGCNTVEKCFQGVMDKIIFTSYRSGHL